MISFEQSESISELSASLVAAQHELKNPPRDSVNPFFHSKYADLATCRNVLVPILAKHGLAVLQSPGFVLENGTATLTTQLLHVSGEWIRTTMLLSAVKEDPQGMGSAITYARRYSLLAITGTTGDDDDDGNAGSHPPGQQAAKPASKFTQNKGVITEVKGKTPTEKLKDEMIRVGVKWSDAIDAINEKEKTAYFFTQKPSDLNPAHIDAYYEWLKTCPDKGQVF